MVTHEHLLSFLVGGPVGIGLWWTEHDFLFVISNKNVQF
jgi:hypothetical protein